jgi:hypothetical protein
MSNTNSLPTAEEINALLYWRKVVVDLRKSYNAQGDHTAARAQVGTLKIIDAKLGKYSPMYGL